MSNRIRCSFCGCPVARQNTMHETDGAQTKENHNKILLRRLLGELVIVSALRFENDPTCETAKAQSDAVARYITEVER